ncbi:MAG TPA: GIY-YIG nuclease family protein [Candidatus Paceibacterota bacterium]
MPVWFTYIVRCVDGSLYTGISTDVEQRVRRHNDGQGAAYTRSHRPVILVWTEEAESESAARKREAQIKGWSRQQKENLVKGIEENLGQIYERI